MGSPVVSLPAADVYSRVSRAFAQHKIPATPENYHVWYTHFAGLDEDLSNTIDALLNAKKTFTEQLNSELFRTYVLPRYTDDQVRRIQQDMQSILKDVITSVATVDDATAAYMSQLESSAKQLAGKSDIADVSGVLRVLADKTIVMARAARESQKGLQAATAQIVTLSEQLKETEQAVLRDPLTGLFNRKATDLRMRELEDTFRESGSPFTVIMADIDYFKKFNDTFGHQVGDAVLRLVGKVLTDTVKGKDFVARYGGEEFICVLPGTGIEGAVVVAEQIREAVHARRLKVVRTAQEMPPITLSLGAAQIKAGESGDQTIARADQALYHAKRTGRNNVKTERDLPSA